MRIDRVEPERLVGPGSPSLDAHDGRGGPQDIARRDEACIRQAEIAQLEGRYLEAAGLWEQAAFEWDPLSRGLQIGVLYFAAGERALAEQVFREAETFALELQRREPKRVELTELSVVQSMLGKHEAALATIDHVVPSQLSMPGAGVCAVPPPPPPVPRPITVVGMALGMSLGTLSVSGQIGRAHV